MRCKDSKTCRVPLPSHSEQIKVPHARGRSPGAPQGDMNGNFKDGAWTAEAIEERKWARGLVSSFAGKGAEDE